MTRQTKSTALHFDEGQDLKVALSEFQPGKRLTINKQSFLVEGVGVLHFRESINNVESLNLTNLVTIHLIQANFMKGPQNGPNRCEAEGCNYIIATTDAKWNINEEESCPNSSWQFWKIKKH